MHRRSLLALLVTAATLPAAAAQAGAVRYALDAARSTVAFEADFGPDKISGTMPVARADLAIDFDRVANSHVSVTLDATRAEASFPFAAQALMGPKVLDVFLLPIEFMALDPEALQIFCEQDGTADFDKMLAHALFLDVGWMVLASVPSSPPLSY